MIWRGWSAVVGAAVGLLAAIAAWSSGASRAAWPLSAAPAGAAVALLVAVSWIAHVRDDDPARGAHLASGASAGLVALPALAAAALGLAPSPLFWLCMVIPLIAAALTRAARLHAPSGGVLRQLRAAALWLGSGSIAVFGTGAALAALAGSGPVSSPGLAREIFDVDAQVATRARPSCTNAPSRVRVLADHGAHPRLEPDARGLWFDAAASSGRRQVHRLELATGRDICWTCDEPGNNLRPDPGRAAVVFESDRDASWRDPADIEVYLLRRRGDRPREPSHRLTRARGPDTYPLLAPGSGRLVWSRRGAAGYEVAWAPIESGHGALLLGAPTPLVRGGGAWVAAAAWSPDARTLALVRGNPFAPLSARGIDLASDAREELGEDVVPDGVAFSGDGGVAAVAGTRRHAAAGLLPAAIGALFAPLAERPDRSLYRETTLRVGARGGELVPLRVPEVEAWGAPTGLDLSPDGTVIYLGQRAADGRERLVEIRRDCR